MYVNIGLTSVLNNFIVMLGFDLKCYPILFFILKSALLALDFKSLSPCEIQPDGTSKKPKYLYSLTVSIFEFLYRKFLFINLPVLLKIIAFVLSIFTLMLFSSVYADSSFSKSFSPSSDSENMIRSSAQMMLLKTISFIFGPVVPA